MKITKHTLVAVALMLMTSVGYTNNFNNTNELNTVKNVRIEFNNLRKGNLLKIKDENKSILYSEVINEEGNLNKIFDFSQLPNGNYEIELDKDFEIIIKEFEVKNQKVIFKKDSKKVIFKPVVRNESNKLLISKIAFDKSPMQVALYYDDEVIYSETVTNETLMNRVYKLDAEKKGTYKVIIYNNDRNFIKEFNI